MANLCGPGVSLCGVSLTPYRTYGKGVPAASLQMRKQAQRSQLLSRMWEVADSTQIHHVSRVGSLYQLSFQTILELAVHPSWGTWPERSFSVLTDISRGPWEPEVSSAASHFMETISTQESLCSKMIKNLRGKKKRLSLILMIDCLNGLVDIFCFWFFFSFFCFILLLTT